MRTSQDLQTGQRRGSAKVMLRLSCLLWGVPSCPCKWFLSLSISMTLHTSSPILCPCYPQPTLSFSSTGELGVFDSNSKSHAWVSLSRCRVLPACGPHCLSNANKIVILLLSEPLLNFIVKNHKNPQKGTPTPSNKDEILFLCILPSKKLFLPSDSLVVVFPILILLQVLNFQGRMEKQKGTKTEFEF